MNIEGIVSCGDDVLGSTASEQSFNEDLCLINRVKANDSVAFDTLVKKYRERLFSIVYNMTSNRDDAFDITQEVFIKAFRGIKGFNGKSAFFTWLYRIAINTSITQINKNRLRRFFSLEILDAENIQRACPEYFVDMDNASKPLFLKELQENLNIALQKLSNKHRSVVVLCEIEGLSSAQAAFILKCSEGTVRSRLHYAKEQLKSYLQNYLH
ncbi:MAG: sigma-70 family RNA polymerase sigma factor [Puniceicoccales bacterium]|jgi:RNA polymerase sigma-70 factor (ECF subfamily)|nr:sigma-70 family RNA polymerase sigma factor [Puniceicoccales bacterium]